MKRVIFLALFLSANPAFALNGNQWLEQTQSTEAIKSYLAFSYLAGMLEVLEYAGIANACPDIPNGVTTEQVQEIIFKWLEDNPENRHFDMPMIAWAALGDAYGFSNVEDDGFCP